MAKPKKPQSVPKSAPLYWVGPYSIEWSYDMVNFHSITFESFGEYASYCHANGRVK